MAGVITLILDYIKKIKCTAEIKGVVSGHDIKAVRNPLWNRLLGQGYLLDSHYTGYYSKVTYSVDGMEYIFICQTVKREPDPKGMEYTIKYIPANPKKCFVTEEGCINRRVLLRLLRIFIICLIIGVYFERNS